MNLITTVILIKVMTLITDTYHNMFCIDQPQMKLNNPVVLSSTERKMIYFVNPVQNHGRINFIFLYCMGGQF